ncbi:helix-turn-helix transcriptional regulator [Kitasatospora sp. NPDC097605]|uniref:helix-turn-helix transcriptional regulator n=1 Tax=Kitasatospora sp. NPDC097605 TaxID=3157226 RepID=UPI003328325A
MPHVEPNPPSPYATADPAYRHILPAPALFPDPRPGALALTACRELAVAPDELTNAIRGDGILPGGLCPPCVTAMTTGVEPDCQPPRPCTNCGMHTEHNAMCALCRMDKHDAARAEQRPGGRPVTRPLTPRERDVLRFTADGLNAVLISRRLGVGEQAVRAEIKRAVRALGARTIDEAIQLHNQPPAGKESTVDQAQPANTTPTPRSRRHPADVTARHLIQHRNTYADKITEEEGDLITKAVALMWEIAFRR